MINYYCGGIVSPDKSAIRPLKSDDGLPMNSCDAVIDEEKIRQFFNTNKDFKIMKTTKEMIEVMQAYDRGEQIEILMNGKWKDNCKPLWEWVHFDYRVKTKKKYVPFDTAEEFLEAQRKHGCELIKIEDGKEKEHYVSVTFDGNVFEHIAENRSSNCMYLGDFEDLLLDDYKFEDGTPCGKEVEE